MESSQSTSRRACLRRVAAGAAEHEVVTRVPYCTGYNSFPEMVARFFCSASRTPFRVLFFGNDSVSLETLKCLHRLTKSECVCMLSRIACRSIVNICVFLLHDVIARGLSHGN